MCLLLLLSLSSLTSSRAAHGGYLQALIFSTARTYFLAHHPTRNQPDPVATHTQFLKLVWSGPVRLSVKAINIGSRVSVIQIELSQSVEHSVSQNSRSHPQSVKFITAVIATVTQGNLATEKGPTLPTVPTIPREEIPDREKDCIEHVDPPYLQELAPASTKVKSKCLPGGVEETFNNDRGRSCRELWSSIADGSNWDVLSLGYLTDMASPTPGISCMMLTELAQVWRCAE